MPSNTIIIFGAGISGLVAAIDLVKSGFKVEVREKRKQLGGSNKWHPSVHQQNFNLEETSKYIGINLAACFHPVNEHTFYFYGRKSIVNSPENSYVCEKGPRSSSIESYLFSIAESLDIKFNFNMPFNLKDIKSDKLGNPQCIVATGLEQELYHELKIKHVNITGFRSSKTISENNSAISFFGEYTNHDFAYLASFKNLMFTLLFARHGVNKKNLEAYQRHLQDSENISFGNWIFSTGCVPLEKNLVKNGVVLTGTISGMIDPFYLNGISGAFLSGKISASFFTDKEKAIQEFNRFTRNFLIKRYLKLITNKLPLKKYSFPIVAYLNNYLKWVGVV